MSSFVWQLVRQLVKNAYCQRFLVPFYLLQIKSAPKHGKLPWYHYQGYLKNFHLLFTSLIETQIFERGSSLKTE